MFRIFQDDFGEFGDAATTDDAFGGFETHSEATPTKSVCSAYTVILIMS